MCPKRQSASRPFKAIFQHYNNLNKVPGSGQYRSSSFHVWTYYIFNLTSPLKKLPQERLKNFDFSQHLLNTLFCTMENTYMTYSVTNNCGLDIIYGTKGMRFSEDSCTRNPTQISLITAKIQHVPSSHCSHIFKILSDSQNRHLHQGPSQ